MRPEPDPPARLYLSPDWKTAHCVRMDYDDTLYLRATALRNALSLIPEEEFDYWKVMEVINKIR